jgi:hypothetical protein
MAQPTTMNWTKLTIWPESDDSPGVFSSRVCGMTSKGFSIAGQTAETVIPDCDDPDLPSWTGRIMRSLSGSVSGSGILAEDNFAFWSDWALSGEPKNVRVVIDLPETPGYFAGSFLLSKFDLTGNLTDAKMQVSLQLDSDGAVTYTTGAPDV